jgi:hypothetical protein
MAGSFEVRFADGRESQWFYWDDNPGRVMRTLPEFEEQRLRQRLRVIEAAVGNAVGGVRDNANAIQRRRF